MNVLAAVLPMILPKAIAWAEAQSRLIMEHGFPLTAAGITDARTVGVATPENLMNRDKAFYIFAIAVLLLFAITFRYETIVASPGGQSTSEGSIYRFDRWTGNVTAFYGGDEYVVKIKK